MITTELKMIHTGLALLRVRATLQKSDKNTLALIDNMLSKVRELRAAEE